MYKHILVAVDDSATSAKALAEAATLARMHGARLEIVHAVDEGAFPTFLSHGGTTLIDRSLVQKALEEEGARILVETKSKVDLTGLQTSERLLVAENTHADDQVAQAVADSGADLLVVGSHGRRGVQRLILGSVAEKLLRKVSVSVLIVRGQAT
jgi:nucleotide-binding universal stress UspA family protein